MRLTLVTGGARSGKSGHAESLARELGGDHVTFVATAEPGDDEMRDRIHRHRAARPPSWITVEAPRHAGAAILTAATPVVVLDCLTLLVSNALVAEGEGDSGAVRAEIDSLVDASGRRSGELIVVTNEVGLGVVPATPLGRAFRDALGEANRTLASRAERLVLMVCGVPLRLRE